MQIQLRLLADVKEDGQFDQSRLLEQVNAQVERKLACIYEFFLGKRKIPSTALGAERVSTKSANRFDLLHQTVGY